MNREIISRLPKAELHCHLDGSISLETLRKLAGRGDLDEKTVKAPVPCHSLAQYLQCFGVVIPLLQTEENLTLAAYDLIQQAAFEHVVYLEVRFAPGFHCTQGLNQQQVCRAVLRGLEQGERDFSVKSRLILCIMRGVEAQQNRDTLECAREMLGDGVAALDLAGDEAGYPTGLYREIFGKASQYDIPFTLHSGECGSWENVRSAVEMGARRIGHGVAIADQEDVKDLCRKNKVCLEMCPISNLQTKAVPDLKDYPFLRLQTEGVAVTINTDNRTVSDTTLTKEWITLAQQFPEIDEKLILKTNLQAVSAAFLPEPEKRALLKQIQEAFPV